MRPAARRLGAVTSVLKDAAQVRISAREPTAFSWLGESHAESSEQGALRGRRIAIKENISLNGAPTSCSSSILSGYISPYTASCVESLQSAGASICGQTKMDEFGMGSLTSHLPRDYGPVHNPSGPKRSKEIRHAGGSSGGSAAAVADGGCWAALGTDTGGSVRLPASYCGVVGLKPSYGLISRPVVFAELRRGSSNSYGVVSYADSLDCVGTLAKTVEIAQSVFEITSKPDAKDMTCVSAAVRSRAKAATEAQLRQLPGHRKSTLEGLRIGIPSQTLLAEPHLNLSEDLLSFLEDQGASFFAVDLPSFASALPAYYVLASAEASSNLARYGGGFFGQTPESLEGESGEARRRRLRTAGFGEEVKKRLLAGTHALSANAFNNTYLKALHLRRQLRREFDRTFRLGNPLRSDATGHPDGVDILLHPTAISTAPRVGEGKADGVDEYAQDVLTVPASLGGLPSMSVPAGRGADGWPVGVSLTGQWGSEDLLFWAGKAVEQWHRGS